MKIAFWKKIICKMRGHQLRTVHEFSPHSRRVRCVRCTGDWALHDGIGVLIPWSGKLHELYEDQKKFAPDFNTLIPPLAKAKNFSFPSTPRHKPNVFRELMRPEKEEPSV